MTAPRKNARLGWVPDLPDHRDRKFKMPPWAAKIPSACYLTRFDSPIYDQEQLGSCTANAIAGLVQFLRRKEKLTDFVPSRLMIYYDERAIEGTISSDAGASLRDGLKVMATQGACDETMWPYIIDRFTQKPTWQCYQSAATDLAMVYTSLDNTQINQLKACLAGGQPFVFGFTVYESFESDKVATTGLVPMPGPDEAILGGHATMVVGYDDQYQNFLVRNSWGTGWGMPKEPGYFAMPYAYMTNPDLCSDFWTISKVGPK